MAFSFLKTGAASAQLAAKAAAEAEQRKLEQGKLFRFWLAQDTKDAARITFVDGELSAEGYLAPPRYYEHNLYLNGNWNNFFVCPVKTNPEVKDVCPICEADDRPALVALFTIIDHRQFQSRDKTKTYKDTKKLFVAKPQTFEYLNKLAVKRDGLVGCTFDVNRVGDKAPAVGNMFDFVVKTDVATLKKNYVIDTQDPKSNLKIKKTNFTPADYEKEIVYRTGAELLKLGLGHMEHPQSEDATETAAGTTDYSKQL